MAMLKKSLYSIIFFISILIGQNTKPTVAILDFEGQGVDASEVQTLSERMRTEIGNTNAVRLIERKAVEKIMMEQGLQQSGCTSDECAAEVGQLLGVQFMISGSIGKMGKSYTIDCKMFSVETGETVRSKNATHDGDISGLLTEMEILAWEITGLDAPASLRLKRAGTDAQSTVAVMDFEGRGITMQEAQTLTDRFMTALASTEKVVLVERGTMVDVLEEQGFESGGCASDECAAEVGAMLGVEFMISGAIGKLGNAYTIDAKMFSVSTGAAESMKSITYAGAVEGLIIEIEILAWDILGLDPPRALKKKRNQGIPDYSAAAVKAKSKTGALMRSMVLPGFGQLYSGRKISGFSFLLLEAGMIGMAAKSNSDYASFQTEYDTQLANYNAATVPADIASYKALVDQARTDMTGANDQLTLFFAAAGGIWLINAIHAFLTGPDLADNGSKLPFRLAYDPTLNQTQLRWEISL
jgi:TolB-like protein